jgi:hypothetical protein
MSLVRRVSAAVVLLFVASPARGQTAPRTIKTSEIRVVAGEPVPTPVPVPPRTVKTKEIRVVAGDPVPTPAPVKPRTIKTDAIRVIAEPPVKGK